MASLTANNNNGRERKKNTDGLKQRPQQGEMEVIHAYLFGLKKQSSYNYHVVQIQSCRSYYKNENNQSERIPVTLLSSGKQISTKIGNLKLFKFTKLDEAESNGGINQTPPPNTCRTLPNNIGIAEIINFVENELNLPQEIGQFISSFLTISDMVCNNIKTVRCSSSSKQHPICEILNSKENTWWISNGPCPQYVEFEICKPTILKQICIKIPPLPYGPLSVRKFAISFVTGSEGEENVPDEENKNLKFTQDERVFETVDSNLLQVFALDPPILLYNTSNVLTNKKTPPRFRVVCLSTAEENQFSVGYFTIWFA